MTKPTIAQMKKRPSLWMSPSGSVRIYYPDVEYCSTYFSHYVEQWVKEYFITPHWLREKNEFIAWL